MGHQISSESHWYFSCWIWSAMSSYNCWQRERGKISAFGRHEQIQISNAHRGQSAHVILSFLEQLYKDTAQKRRLEIKCQIVLTRFFSTWVTERRLLQREKLWSHLHGDLQKPPGLGSGQPALSVPAQRVGPAHLKRSLATLTTLWSCDLTPPAYCPNQGSSVLVGTQGST